MNTVKFVPSVFWALVTFLAPAVNAQPALIAMPSAVVTTSDVRSYQPFNVALTFSRAYCIQTQSPRFARVDSQADSSSGGITVSVYLSQLSGNAPDEVCSPRQIINMAGMPPGNHRLRFYVTDSQSVALVAPVLRSATVPVEVGELSLSVLPRLGEVLSPIVTCEVNSNVPDFRAALAEARYCGFQPFPVVPSKPPLRALEVDVDGKLGRAFATTVVANVTLEPPYVPLYRISYPEPLRGTVWTTSLKECTSLQQAWGDRRVDTCANNGTHVLAMENGVCPIGSSRVYRLFNAKEVEHRYTQDEAMVPLLVGLGFVSEGAAFCALSR